MRASSMKSQTMRDVKAWRGAGVLRVLVATSIVASAGAAWSLGIFVLKRPEFRSLEPGKTKIDVKITDNLARTRVHQEFFNPNSRPLEADFVFPLPPGANVTDFVVYVDGKPQNGELLEKEKAHEIYSDIVRRLRDPGLLEWLDWNLFRVAVFPVPPNASQSVEIEFAQKLAADQGTYQYLFPMAGPGVRGAGPARASGGERSVDGGLGNIEFRIEISADHSLGNIYSPTHKVEVRRHEPNTAQVEVAVTDREDLHRNFILVYDYRDKEIAATLLAARRPPDPGFFCLSLSPDSAKQERTTVPLDLIIILDTSGSMSEQGKIDQARRAVQYCLGQLTRNDRFALIRFATDAESYRSELTTATKEEVARAQDWVSELRAAGGTNISEALEAAAKLIDKENGLPEAKQRRRLVLFVTDGLPTVGVTSVDEILAKAQKAFKDSATRVFTFGVGHDVNTRLLDRLAEQTRACSEYVAPQQDLEVPVSRLFDKVARPALSEVEVQIEGAEVFDVYPKDLPDLFYGTELTVFGRYKKPGTALIKLKGKLAGQPVEYVYEKTFPEEAQNAYIERLWATRKIGFLLDQLRNTPDSKELREEIIALSKRYGIVTPLTSYLVVEDRPEMTRAGGPVVPNAASDGSRRRGDVVDRKAMPGTGAVAPAAARMFGASSGAEAVAASKMVRQLKEASVTTVRPEAEADVQWVGGRTFVRDGDVWMEEGTKRAENVIRIKSYSSAYFELLRRHPELREIFQLGDKLRFKLGSHVVEIAEDGVETLPEELTIAGKEKK